MVSGQAKSMCFAAGMVAGMGCKTLARALANSALAVFALLNKFQFGLVQSRYKFAGDQKFITLQEIWSKPAGAVSRYNFNRSQ